ncbi:MAG: FAD-dependent protein [Bacteroidota bacterium]
MAQTCTIQVPPEYLHEQAFLEKAIARSLKLSPHKLPDWHILRRSIDARKKKPLYVLRIEIGDAEATPFQPEWKMVREAPEVIIAGTGPAGLFAALELIQQGVKPLLIDRGKAVRARRRDLAALTKEGKVNPDSNYCFGEGGAGTFSDGKLYTRSLKRGNTESVLRLLVHFGATEDILIDAHPHIGTNKLPEIIQNMREHILACGGEIHFDTRLTDIHVQEGKLTAIEVNGNEKWDCQQLILATGHSARDIFKLLVEKNIQIQAKPFALGVRVEHPQKLIDQIQYHQSPRHENLPAASYSLVKQVDDRGVYSFCMCPGGIICPASTEEGEVVVNGWSPSKRNNPFANSGIVVQINPEDITGFEDSPLSAMNLQAKVEQRAFEAGGGKQVAPAQRLMDFLNSKPSSTLPDCSYIPGLNSVNMKEVLPKHVAHKLRNGFRLFGKQLKGYLTNEAVIVGVESRTSSPVKIPRERESCMHPEVEGLYPCGEGAGYAGGIMSAALDGVRCAKAISSTLVS